MPLQGREEGSVGREEAEPEEYGHYLATGFMCM